MNGRVIKTMDSQCHHCLLEKASSSRNFSEKAWEALLEWGEIEKTTVYEPLCQDCYEELRDVLIDRHSELQESERVAS